MWKIESPIVAAAEAPRPVVVLALDRDFKPLKDCQRLVGELRRAGIQPSSIWAPAV